MFSKGSMLLNLIDIILVYFEIKKYYSHTCTKCYKLIVVHYIEIKISGYNQENNLRISLQSAKSISENREKLNGLLLSYKNTNFDFQSLLGLKSLRWIGICNSTYFSRSIWNIFQFSECE